MLAVEADGYAGVTAMADLLAGQTLLFSPSLQAIVSVGVSLEGIVTDQDTGMPLAGVTVQVTPFPAISP